MDRPDCADTSVANPTLATLYEVQDIVRRESEGDAQPLSLAEIGRRMNARKTRHETLRVTVQALEAWGVVAVGSKGVVWTWAPASVTQAPRDAL